MTAAAGQNTDVGRTEHKEARSEKRVNGEERETLCEGVLAAEGSEARPSNLTQKPGLRAYAVTEPQEHESRQSEPLERSVAVRLRCGAQQSHKPIAARPLFAPMTWEMKGIASATMDCHPTGDRGAVRGSGHKFLAYSAFTD